MLYFKSVAIGLIRDPSTNIYAFKIYTDISGSIRFELLNVKLDYNTINTCLNDPTILFTIL